MDFTVALLQARGAAKSGQCHRRQIGCVLLDNMGAILSRGCNGPPHDLGSCVDGELLCPGRDVPAGQGNAQTPCYGIHAEVRALLEVPTSQAYWIFAIVSTKAPCLACTLMLLDTTCCIIAFETASNEVENKKVWEKAGRTWLQL